MELEVKEININDINEAEYNPRTISNTELTKLKNNIQEFGIVDPIVVNLKNNTIIGGHQRYKALQAMGIQRLQMIEIGNMGWVFNTFDLDVADEENEKILNLALNNISGEWNERSLSNILQELKTKTTNYKLTGFDDLDIEQLKIDTEVLFEDNIIGKSWDKFKEAQGDENWREQYEEEPEEYLENPEDEEYYEEEDLENLKDGIIRDDTIIFEEEILCPNCKHKITFDMFEKNYYDKVDE